jgi:tetratricopeptide (TPR) repeat protein
LCVSIIATLWQEQPFSIATLPTLQGQFTERALLKFVGERILDKRLKTPFRELTRYGIVLRSFNLPMLQAVFPHLHIEYEQFRQFVSYPYIEPVSNRRYAVHSLLREIQADELREQEPDEWQEYHRRALEYLTISQAQQPDSYYHAIELSQEEGMSDWWDAIQSASFRRAQEEFSALLEVAQDSTLKLTPGNQAKCIEWQGDFYRITYQMDAAIASYELALSLFQQVGSKLGEANVRQAMGDVLQFRKDMQAALASYELALSLFQQVGSKLGEANCYLAQGRVALEEGDYQGALSLHTHAYDLYQVIQDQYSQARLLYYRSWVYEALEERALAVQDVQAALGICRQFDLPIVEILQRQLDELRKEIQL